MKLTKNQINSIIELHASMKNAYFWNPPANASGRRKYENRHSMKIEGVYNNNEISLECKTECSCRNIYYKGYFYINGERCTVRKIKKLVA